MAASSQPNYLSLSVAIYQIPEARLLVIEKF